MSISFSLAQKERMDELFAFYQNVIAAMRHHGLREWEWGVYPSEQLIRRDIAEGSLYLMEEDGKLLAAFAISARQEEEYARVPWLFGVKPATLHRLAMAPESYGLGMAQRVMVFVKVQAQRLGFDSLRMDSSGENERMLKLFRSAMSRTAGVVTFDDPSRPYFCFESPLSDACPMLPIRMHPAYRYGEMTPWGGDQLSTVFGKNIPDPRTGESLEISAIPGLESRDDMKETLPALCARYGAQLLGQDAQGPFPLLLKLIAARDTLSVQVHPDDAYAAEHEHKLGKSEAWVILHADKGASILYGIREGVSRADFERAVAAGEPLDPLIRRVEAHAGDVFYMPSGMVHAIGAGIVLYEIQQSSDVTYRLWDYNRTNAKGEKRPLHLKQALDVMQPALRGEITRIPDDEGTHRLLTTPAFTLDSLTVCGRQQLPRYPQGMRMLTALAGLLLSWPGDALELKAGESVLLPATCPELMISGVGKALVSAVNHHA